MSLEQITGIPCRVEDGEHAKFTKPEIFNFDALDYKPNGYEKGKTITILLIDDMHLADKVIQKYLFQLLTYKSINSYSLPDNCAIILAGNKMTDKALAHTIPAPVMNRIAVFEVKAEPKDWLKNYAFKNNVRDDITSFINAKGDAFFTQEPLESMPWASPRSWTFLSEQIDEFEDLYGEVPIDKLKLISNSLIGEEYTSEFIAYREIFNRWDISKLVKYSDKDILMLLTKEIAKNPIAAYAAINATLTWMINESKKNEFDASNKDVIKAVESAYNVMTLILQVKSNEVQIKPLVIAGASYLYMYYNAVSFSALADKIDDVITLFLNQMKKKRDIDWIFYEIIAYVNDYKISSEDRAEIEKAKKNLK